MFSFKKQQLKSYESSEKKAKFEEEVKKKVMTDAKEGKRPQFINKCNLFQAFYFKVIVL